MSELKTKPNDGDVGTFLASIRDEAKRRDAERMLALMSAVTKEKPKMWGTSIVGFGRYRYTTSSGREGEWFLTGFSPRKQALTLYIMSGFEGHGALLKRLGPHKTGRSCLYVKRLDDVDTKTLKALVTKSVASLARGRC